MKSGISSLNPYAASYVPLSKREAKDENKVFKLMPKDDEIKASLAYNPRDTVPKGFTMKYHNAYDSFGSSSQNRNEISEKQILDEEFDMDLAYLQMTFPGVSDQSLTDVYVANKGDLEATVDMLSQLEDYTFESPENLPDTLDIGDVSESKSSTECASLKLKEVAGETSGTSSGGSSGTNFGS